ncbi:MAG: hypothetical protein CSA70_05195 [Rhodobacterales bacterium]|nr:MAG: hypothetical protein CSA70_05195 [Rhodobacterales bacterium]
MAAWSGGCFCGSGMSKLVTGGRDALGCWMRSCLHWLDQRKGESAGMSDRVTLASFPQVARFLCMAMVVVLAGCGRPALWSFADPIPGATIQPLYVATMRQPEQGGKLFGKKRSNVMHYGRVDVSVPPVHKPGQLERGHRVANPAWQFVPVAAREFRGVEAFLSAVGRARRNAKEPVFIFVHGYNNTLEDAALRLAQIRQDFEIREPTILFSWPSAGQAVGYIYDRDSVLFARDDFEMLLRDLSQRGHDEIFIMAHSMGGYLTMETLRQLALKRERSVMNAIDGVVLMSPDIDPDVFRRQAQDIGRLPDPFVIMTARQDKALSISGLLTGRKPRLGRISSAKEVEGLGVMVLDFTRLADGKNLDHLIPVTSSAAIRVLKGMQGTLEQGRNALANYVVLGDEMLGSQIAAKAEAQGMTR